MPLRQVFLGTLVLGDEARAMQYGRDTERDVAGFVERIGPSRWRLIMPRPHFESQIDVMELVPSSTGSALMKLILGIAIAAMTLPSSANAAALPEAIKADMPQLMALYRDLHANPELSMQEVRTPAKLAAEARKLGFKVTEKVGKTGVVAVMENGPGPGAPASRRHGRAAGRRADRPAVRVEGPGNRAARASRPA